MHQIHLHVKYNLIGWSVTEILKFWSGTKFSGKIVPLVPVWNKIFEKSGSALKILLRLKLFTFIGNMLQYHNCTYDIQMCMYSTSV